MTVEQEGHAEHTKLACFLLQGQEFAADIFFVKESLTMRPITNVALTPRWLAGIINLRGDVVAVLDLSLFLGMPKTEIGPGTRIVVATHQGRRAGFLCDKLCDLRSHSLDDLEPPPTTLDDTSAAVLAGVLTLDDGQPLRVLDLGALFESRALASFRRGDPA
ncbi:MAG: hypothetical protein GY811_30560 [Myxococcales bacterium]|nr:hypothetical protein [Myxococcales bacterium]